MIGDIKDLSEDDIISIYKIIYFIDIISPNQYTPKKLLNKYSKKISGLDRDIVNVELFLEYNPYRLELVKWYFQVWDIEYKKEYLDKIKELGKEILAKWRK